MPEKLTNPTIEVNNQKVRIKPNSFDYTDGLGEQELQSYSGGGGDLEVLYVDNIETHMATVKFTIPSTVDNVQLVRDWKLNKNANLIQVYESNTDGSFTRTFPNAALLNDTEVGLGSDKDIELEFKSSPAI